MQISLLFDIAVSYIHNHKGGQKWCLTAEKTWVYYVIPKIDQAGLEMKRSIPSKTKKKVCKLTGKFVVLVFWDAKASSTFYSCLGSQ